MADLVSLSILRSKVRTRTDMAGSTFVQDTELNGYIRDSWKALYDLLVESVEDYNITPTTSTISSGNSFALPATFYKMRGLDDYSNPSNPLTVRKFNFQERNDYGPIDTLANNSVYSDVLYRIVGSNIVILPPDRAKRTYQLWYVPTPPTLTNDSDTIDVINGFDEYIVLDAGMKCLIKEESDVSAFVALRNNVENRIRSMTRDRDQAQPEKVSRVRNSRRNAYRYYDL